MKRSAVLLAAAATLAAPPAAAEPAEVEQRTSSLSWVRLPGAESCIGTRALAEAVEARLGRTVVVSAAAADISIEGRVEQAEAPTRFRATVVASDEAGEIQGERVLESEDATCGALGETLALVIAVMIDPAAALPDRGDGEPGPATEPDLEPEPGLEPEPAAPAPGPGLRVDLTAAYVIGVGTLPGVPMGPGLSLIVDPVGFWPLELELSALLGATVADEAGSARMDQLRAAAFVCAPWDLGAVRLHGCGGLAAGATRAVGAGFDRPIDTWSALVEGVARLRVLYNPVSVLVLRADLSLLVPLFRDRVVYRDGAGGEQLLFEAAPVGGAFDVGVGVLFD